MARRKHIQKEKSKKSSFQKNLETYLSVRMQKHLTTLHFKSVEHYLDWCEVNKFKRSLDKTKVHLKAEVDLANSQRATKALEVRRACRSLDKIVEDVLTNKINSQNYTQYKNKVSASYYKIIDTLVSNPIHPKAHKLFLKIAQTTDLLEELAPHVVREPVAPNKLYLHGILKLCKNPDQWIGDPNTWEPTSHNSWKQFSSLASHLFAKYYVPGFMDAAWFELQDWYRTWYLHIGIGQNIRKASRLPFPLTKMMAHHFLQAPDYCSILQALRWGQVFGMGGDARIANAIINTKLGQELMSGYGPKALETEEFWASVIRFFIANPMCDTDQIGPIIDYIQNQKYMNQRVMVQRGVWVDRPPAQPNFSMHGRSIPALIRSMETWHKQLGRPKKNNLHWEPCKNIKEFKKEEAKRTWIITELLSSAELKNEGRAMRNCVYSYEQSCASGRCSVWTLDCLDTETQTVTKHATIEVRNFCVTQARRQYNEKITDQLKLIINQWASQNKLTVGTYL